ncbi:Bacterial type II secretion system protein F domain protein [Anatilimnocola aggregata]|uniref:Bacterial type II secretion system protein F domain protein n=1 Tax=Anatilimnocola aggregata TaxID=2528021 RepID=A0A517YN36_9BACT|nr:type II secretion system F family protein [Anatilimnocola aggregata]QDU31646.1 Bacterial type II secretion system protein F domain protein [Anatilimnocola aggregata]
MNSLFVAGLTFVSVAMCVVGVVMLVIDLCFRNQNRIRQRMQEEFGDVMQQRAKKSPLFKDLLMTEPDEQLTVGNLMTQLQTLLDQAGLPWTAPMLLLSMCIGPVVAALLTAAITRNWLLTAIAAACMLPLPWLYVWRTRECRRAKLCAQLPDAFDVMSRALRAGQSVPGAFQVIVSDFPSPIKDEFAFCYEQQHLGIAQEVALRDLARRTGVMELQIFVVAMVVHLRVGGNLSELLTKLSSILRKRAQIQGRVKALTGEGRLQAVVLIALPALVFAALYLLNREYAQILLDRPWILAGCVGSQSLGAICIQRLLQIDF